MALRRRWDAGRRGTTKAVAKGRNDVALVEAALQGQPGARRRLANRLLDAIHREIAISVLRWAGRSGHDHHQEINDLVQEVLVALFEHDARELRRWDPKRGRSLESFVALVARRRASRVLGRGYRDPVDLPSEEPPETPDDASLVDRLEQRAELGAVLRMLYAQMNPRDMELFDLLFVQGLDPAEVASRLDISRGAVNAWSYRTRKLARTLVRARLDSDSNTNVEARHG
ncbi:MAG: sigma-70 family RNA polymerase sigma factor [Myxococcota bacterium]